MYSYTEDIPMYSSGKYMAVHRCPNGDRGVDYPGLPGEEKSGAARLAGCALTVQNSDHEEDEASIAARTTLALTKADYDTLKATVLKQASKQLLLMGWPTGMSEQDRDKEIRGMAQYYGVADKLQGTTTLKNKQGLGHFTIVHMWDKDARNTFLHNVKNDPHKIKGNTIVGRPQIPRYRREQDAPMKCAMKALATIYGGNPKFRPTWELQALWYETEWVLAVATDANDATKVTIFVPDDKKEEFETQFAEDWPTWQNRGNQTEGSPQKYLRINIIAFTDDALQELNERYANMSTRSRSSRPSDDVDMANADEEVRLKLGARRQQAPRPRWDFHSASPRNIREMNEALEARLDNIQSSDDVSQTWDLLREVFVQAMEEHIPKYQFAPRKPWISQSTLDLITRRGVLRSQGDLQQVAEYNKDIKRSAKRDKKNWLEEQLQSNSWEPIKQLKKSLPTKMVRLEPSPSLGISPTATNADIYAAHLEQVQWAPAASPGVEDLSTDLLPHAAPDIEEGPLTMAELIQAIKHLKSGKSAGQDNIPNEFWKNLSGKGLEALLDLFQDCWSHGKSPSTWKQSQVIGIFKKGIPTTWGAMVIGCERIPNEQEKLAGSSFRVPENNTRESPFVVVFGRCEIEDWGVCKDFGLFDEDFCAELVDEALVLRARVTWIEPRADSLLPREVVQLKPTALQQGSECLSSHLAGLWAARRGGTNPGPTGGPVGSQSQLPPSDIVLVADGQRFEADRVLLAARSSYFAGMLAFREAGQREVLLPVPSRALASVLRFAYTDDAPELRSYEEAVELLEAASQLSFAGLQRHCSDYLRDTWLTLENVLQLLRVADQHGATSLRAEALAVIAANFDAVKKTEPWEEFLQTGMNPMLIQDLLQAVQTASVAAGRASTRF
ncbi:Klhl22 [Symbiodinium sp. CCMP2592]|nr:Klhl22 [Symbiodinium sp. CCMP2592]